MNPLLKDMHDIKSIDSISIWPLAAGWWILIAIILAIFFTTYIYLKKQKAKKNSWQQHALNELDSLSKNILKNPKDSHVEILSNIIRRVALHIFDRKTCAGITGDKWLNWLAENDPNNFNWNKYGKVLGKNIYSANKHICNEELQLLINAIKLWVK